MLVPGLRAWPVAILALLAAVAGALPPLHETDLAQHLATGEWIVRARAVPFVEPFAWTREGQPYFAYSWFMQVTYYLLLDRFGPLALHLLGGSIAAVSVLAAYWAGRQLGRTRGASAGLAVLNLALLWGVANTLRPQQVLFVVVPLVWGIAARIDRRGLTVPRGLALTAAAALAANSHLFFPITAAPVGYFLLTRGHAPRWIGASAALLAGWLITPYALAWPQVFALNFGHNVLLSRPPTILEFRPGLEYARERAGVIICALAMLAAPWIGAASGGTPRQRTVRALFWSGGLLLFVFAGRLVLVWWTLAFPLVGDALQRARAALAPLSTPRARSTVTVGIAGIVFSVAAPPVSPVFWMFEGDTQHRMLPRAGEDPALWLPSWLLCNTHPGAHGRLFTEFNYGSELTWRLPGYSPSIDGRTIFADSIARDFAYSMHGRRRAYASTWRSADLALLDRSFWLAPVLDADPGWILLAEGRRTSRGSHGALWARREWWARWGTTAAVPALAIFPGDPRGACPAAGDFPAWRGRGPAG